MLKVKEVGVLVIPLFQENPWKSNGLLRLLGTLDPYGVLKGGHQALMFKMEYDHGNFFKNCIGRQAETGGGL